MIEKLNKIRMESPNFDKELVNNFANNMPDLLSILIDGKMYDNHIGSKDVALLAQKYITNDKDEHIGFKWDYETIINTVKTFVDIDKMPFYPCDIWVWANVKYGDMSELKEELKHSTIVEYAISELLDTDYPFYDASQRPYYWLKAHIQKSEREN